MVTVVAVRGPNGLLIDHGCGPSIVVKPRVTDIMDMLLHLHIIPNFVGLESNATFRLENEAGHICTRIESLIEQIELPDGVVRTKESHKYSTLEKGTDRCGGRGAVLDPMNLAFVEGKNRFYVTLSLPVGA
jgi:hypothetical protein